MKKPFHLLAAMAVSTIACVARTNTPPTAQSLGYPPVWFNDLANTKENL